MKLGSRFGGNVLGLAIAAVLLSAGAARRADARLLQLTVQADVGGSVGRGTANDDTDTDFFNVQSGGAFGGKLGIEFLFIDAWVEHQQFFKGGLKGSWTQLMLGTDFDFPLSEDDKLIGTVGTGLGFGIGTLQSVDPPLDKAQVENKGFVAQLSIDLDYKLSQLVSLGVSLPIGYHYLFEGDQPANDPNSQSNGVHAMGLVTMKFQKTF
ncbi:MAG: hypothetical protein IT370_10325 [Deltaproteobacteria bacterium]|nr:hypothetical protein [Deltaproteobacteria bacterium]